MCFYMSLCELLLVAQQKGQTCHRTENELRDISQFRSHCDSAIYFHSSYFL